MSHEITVTHSTSTGHRIPGHDGGNGKCARLHGHTYVFDVALLGDVLGPLGFVADFGAVKAILDEWDHRIVLWTGDRLEFRSNSEDELAAHSGQMSAKHFPHAYDTEAEIGVVRVPFIPTAELMAEHLARRFVADLGVRRARVAVHEGPKTSATFTAEADA